MTKLAELENYKPSNKKKIYSNTLKYFEQDISPLNHPTALANHILNTIQHTVTYGAQFIAPMGHGKTTAATVVAHHIHTKRPEFLVVWGESDDFMDLKGFLAKQPKQPLIIIFDDITGALKQMGEKEMQANFNILTKIRWEVDPEKGKIPVITFCTYHYSKNLEKEFRAVLGMTCFCSFGNEERTNIDTLAPKGTLARYCLEKFSRIAGKMFSEHEFYLTTQYGSKQRYVTDEPLRPFASITGNNGYITVFSEDDVCNLCAKKKHAKYVEPEKIIEIVRAAYGPAGFKALKLAMWRRGYYLALGKDVAPASDFIERKVLPNITTNFPKLVDEIYKASKKKAPKRIYHHRQLEKDTLKELNDNSIDIELTDPNETLNTNSSEIKEF